jgi:hypothetical protein
MELLSEPDWQKFRPVGLVEILDEIEQGEDEYDRELTEKISELEDEEPFEREYQGD